MSKPFQGIFFDMGGTLIFPDPARIALLLQGTGGPSIPPSEVLEAIHHATVELDAGLVGGRRLGEEWWEAYFGAMLRHLPWERPLKKVEIKEFFSRLREDHEKNNLWSFLADGAMELLERLKTEGYFLGVISNSDGRVQSQLEENGLAHFFSFVLDSFVVKCEKPGPEIFHLALKKSGLSARDVLYVGDFVNIDFRGATEVGMAAVILDPLQLRDSKKIPTIQRLRDLPEWLTRKV